MSISEKEETILKLIDDNLTIKEIIKKTGHSRAMISYYAKKNNRKTRRAKLIDSVNIEGHIGYIVLEYMDGESIEGIRSFLGISNRSLRKIIKDLNLTRPRKQIKQRCEENTLTKTFFNSYKRGAERRGLKFSITMEYAQELFLFQKKKCSISGLNIEMPTIRIENKTASLDRIDSSKGYIEGNVQWVHKDVNKLKNNFDEKYFIELCSIISENNK